MIKDFVQRFMNNKHKLKDVWKDKHPENYGEIVRETIKLIVTDSYGEPDIDNITVINQGDYQGTLVYVIPEKTYQPDTYWYVKIFYGSCSGCDTLQGICDYSDNVPNEEQLKDYETLCLHVIQKLRVMGDTV